MDTHKKSRNVKLPSHIMQIHKDNLLDIVMSKMND